MCEISMIYALESKLTKEEIVEMLSMMQTGANVANDDGWGIFNSRGKFAKAPGKFDIKKVSDGITKLCNDSTSFVVGHVRNATHGAKTKDNTHPIIYKDITLVHNGVIQNEMALRQKFTIPRDPKVDSYVIAWLLNHFFKKGMSWEESIKEVSKEIRGNYSVFFMADKRLFYFRDGADFYFKLIEKDGKHFILGNTKQVRLSTPFSDEKFGFKMNKARTLSYLHPKESELYEFSESGVTMLCDLPSPEEEIVELPDNAKYAYGYMKRFADDNDDICDESYGQR